MKSSPMKLKFRIVAWIMSALVFTGCQSLSNDGLLANPLSDSLYAELGGQAAIEKLVNKFVARLHYDPRLKELFVETNKQELKQNIADFICEITDGGCDYQGASMEDIHSGLEITKGEFDYFVSLFILSMKCEEIPFKAQNRLLAKLAAMRGAVINL